MKMKKLFSDSHSKKSKSGRKDNQDGHSTMLSEDYAEIVDDEGDYSTPAGKTILT